MGTAIRDMEECCDGAILACCFAHSVKAILSTSNQDLDLSAWSSHESSDPYGTWPLVFVL
jgi:hypothetical protein